MKRFVWVVALFFLGVFLLSFFGTLSLIYQDHDQFSLVDANIGVLEITGPITDSLPVLEQIQTYRETPHLKGLVVRVDTPGGAIGASQEIYMELKKLSEKDERPLIMSLGNVAASGGLYVSLGAPKVLSLPGTITGSMGVIVPITNFSRLAKKLHVDPVAIKSGDLKDAGNPLKPLDPKAERFLQEMVDAAFEQFQADVKSVRELTDEQVQFLSDGRVINGLQAQEIGIVHEIGTFSDAVTQVQEAAKLEKVELGFLSRKPKSLIERVLESTMSPVGEWMSHSVELWFQNRLPVPEYR